MIDSISGLGLWIGSALALATAVGIMLRRRNADGGIQSSERDARERGEALPSSIEDKSPVVTDTRDPGTDSDALLQSLFDHAPTAIAMSDLSGRHLMANQAAADQYGLSIEELCSQPASFIFSHFENAREIAPDWQELLRSGKPFRRQVRFRKPGQPNLRHLDLVAFPVRDNGGRIVQIGSLATDVTDEVRDRSERIKAEAMLHSFVENSPFAMDITDLSGSHTMINSIAADHYGATADEIRAADPYWVGKFWPEHQSRILPLFREVVRNKENRVIETKMNSVGAGREIDVLLSIFPLFDETGEVEAIGTVGADITATKEAQRDLIETREILQAFVDNAPLAINVRDPGTDTFVIANQKAADLWGVSVEELLATNVGDLTQFGLESDVIADAIQNVLQTGTPQTAETSVQPKSESDPINLLLSLFPIRLASGSTLLAATGIDVTEMHQARQQLEANQQMLHQSEKLAALGQLLAGVAHELNNPLAIVVGRAAMLQDKLDGTPHAVPLEKLRGAADRCSRIVKTFLAMARQSGPRESLTDVNELVESAMDLTVYGLRTAGVEVVQNLEKGLPVTHADGDQIVQVLINLFVNAQHAMEGTPGPNRLIVSTIQNKKSGTICIDVADTGTGIPDDIATRIFEPFFTTKQVGAGTGMGLSVSKGMIEAQGGSLDLVSNGPAGAVFRITIPVRTAELEERIMAVPAQPMSTEGRVLIVDDEAEIAEMLEECLSPLGVECAIASDGGTALDMIAKGQFDAVLTDVRMPGMDGQALYERLRIDRPELANRLAFISGDVLHRNPDRAAAIGERPIIEKPFDPDLVRAVVRDLLGQGA